MFKKVLLRLPQSKKRKAFNVQQQRIKIEKTKAIVISLRHDSVSIDSWGDFDAN
jgi:hypothetical protein